MMYLQDFLFNQNNTEVRRKYFYFTLISIIGIMLLTGPYHSLVTDYVKILYPNGQVFGGSFLDIFLNKKNIYNILRFSSLVFIALSLIKKIRKWGLLFCLFTFHSFQYFHYKLTPYAWNFNTHLSFFLLVLCLSYFLEGTKYEKDFKSFTISFPIFYIGTLYFQAGISKLFHGGFDWITSGRTLLQFSYFLGTDFGRSVVALPYMAQIISFISVVVELLVIFFIFVPKTYRVLGILLVMFHVGIKLTMDISFWHLIVLFPALFVFGNPGFQYERR